MRWTTAVSRKPSLPEAVAECAAGVEDGLGGARPTLVLAFLSPHHAEEYDRLPALVKSRLKTGALVGCSGGGVIGGGEEVEQGPALTLTAAHLPGVEVEAFQIGGELPDLDGPPGAWEEVVGVGDEREPQFVLLSDPFSGRPDALLAGLDYAFPASVKVGGLASGGASPGSNALFAGGEVYGGGTVGVWMSGDLIVDPVVAQGCRPVGGLMQVTSCKGNVLYEVDDEPALDVLRELFEEMDAYEQELARTSLFMGVMMDEFEQRPGVGDFLIRNILGADPRSGALAVGESLQEGMRLCFHLRDAAASAEELHELLAGYRSSLNGAAPAGALLFSCLGRGEGLYGEPGFDSRVFCEHVGGIPVGGFFCNGEIGPVAGRTYLHGYTSSFGVFRPA